MALKGERRPLASNGQQPFLTDGLTDAMFEKPRVYRGPNGLTDKSHCMPPPSFFLHFVAHFVGLLCRSLFVVLPFIVPFRLITDY